MHVISAYTRLCEIECIASVNNWDGNYSKAVSKLSLQSGKRLIKAFAYAATLESISPTSVGALEFVWVRGTKIIRILVRNDSISLTALPPMALTDSRLYLLAAVFNT